MEDAIRPSGHSHRDEAEDCLEKCLKQHILTVDMFMVRFLKNRVSPGNCYVAVIDLLNAL